MFFSYWVTQRFHGDPPTALPVLPPIMHGRVVPMPVKILQTRLRRDTWYLLVQWQGLTETEATWEYLDQFKQLYPEF